MHLDDLFWRAVGALLFMLLVAGGALCMILLLLDAMLIP